ncbi:serine/threonine-protein kinase [Streptomyces sp. DH24]|uniref:serine/threonine-protein kinase n=1 Tax=Streptomyces sp. DH24 TaxID=3040123 RepID=UPI0024431AB8|nr:serine/threonine-protein kinase [Streptomyces sp. DH24]MDG9716882.1 serine/threonine-protein kinase [Streptomyces sp. DH24]
MSNDGDGTGVEGRLVAGRYRLAERIGSGGLGTVWRARDELVGREVAVKEPRLPGDPEEETHRRAAHRLYREARAAARVDHPAAVTIHDVVVEDGDGPDGLPWIVMELVPGESLREVLRRGPVDAPEAARIGLAVLGALRAGHAVGIVHRDVKPANVLLGPQRRVVLTDFGVAPVHGEDSAASAAGAGEFAGSLEYVAPECMSDRTAGPASDLWSLGALLYAAVEGSSPFRRTSPEATLAAILACDPPEPENAGPLGPLIARLLVREPERRPDADEVGKVLETVAGPEAGDDVEPTEPHEPVATEAFEEAARADGGSPPAPAPAPVSRRRRLFRTTPFALLGGLLLLAGLWSATLVGGPGSGTAAERTPAGPATGGATWTAHRAEGMDATLSLPSPYHAAGTDGSATEQPRVARYHDERGGAVRVRLSQWDRAPRTPLEQAREAHRARDGHDGDARTRYTRTSVRGHEAVIADTTCGPDTRPRRIMQAVVRTGDGRLYELRVDMPRGTEEEKEGAAVFRGARDRIRFGSH